MFIGKRKKTIGNGAIDSNSHDKTAAPKTSSNDVKAYRLTVIFTNSTFICRKVIQFIGNLQHLTIKNCNN